MKIVLEKPFSKLWRKGYLVINNQNRRNVILFNSSTDRTTISYARYLLSVKLGKFIPKHLHVDHIDNDKTNDSLSNLQLLSARDNIVKGTVHKYGIIPDHICPYCGSIFKPTRWRINQAALKGSVPKCSKSCASRHRWL